MNLKINKRGHWQLPDGFELRSGDHIEIYVDGCWIQGEINYRPPGQYQIWLRTGQVLDMNGDVVLRIVNQDWAKFSKSKEEGQA